MPNWVHNRLTITGPEDAVSAFLAGCTKDGEVVMCESYLPLPPEASVKIAGTDFTGFADLARDGVDGYQMALDLWGTKWGDCNTVLTDRTPGSAYLEYDTAWGPLEVGTRNLSALFPALWFTTSGIEEQPCWCGWFVYHNGTKIGSGDLGLDDGPQYIDDMDEEAEMEYEDQRHEWEEELASLAHVTAVNFATMKERSTP